MPTHEVNSLELEFLFSINFALHVPTDVYERYYAELANHMGVGVPPELLAANTCDCARFVESIAYDKEALDYTGACTCNRAGWRGAPAPTLPPTLLATQLPTCTARAPTAPIAAQACGHWRR